MFHFRSFPYPFPILINQNSESKLPCKCAQNHNLQARSHNNNNNSREPYNLRGRKFRWTCVHFADGYSLSYSDNNLSVHGFMWLLQHCNCTRESMNGRRRMEYDGAKDNSGHSFWVITSNSPFDTKRCARNVVASGHRVQKFRMEQKTMMITYLGLN